jgi:hypothetical protein
MNLLHGIRFDNTLRIKQKCESGEYDIPEIKRGNERCRFNVGDDVITSGLGNMKAGNKGKVVDMYEQNGYWTYSVQFGKYRSNQRDKDLV